MVESQKTKTFSSNGKSGSYDVYQVRGDANGTALFEFMAANTTVEWSKTATGVVGDKGLNFLTTSHNYEIEEGIADYMYTVLRHGYAIRGHDHNHPSNRGSPSISDIQFSDWVKKYTKSSKEIYFNVYTPKNDVKYHPYNNR